MLFSRLWILVACLLQTELLLKVEAKESKIIDESSKYSWKLGGWGRCNKGFCGQGGMQHRNVYCSFHGFKTFTSNCDRSMKPDSYMSCFRPCTEQQGEFLWNVGKWGQCQLEKRKQKQRGRRTKLLKRKIHRKDECVNGLQQGLKRRNVRCKNITSGLSTPNYICEFFSKKPDVTQMCFKQCQTECYVSEWQQWSPCSKPCGGGTKERTRRILVDNSNDTNDVLCPNLEQKLRCNKHKCYKDKEARARSLHSYTIRIHSWGGCRPLSDLNTTNKNLPRIGNKTRKVQCMRSDGLEVELDFCRESEQESANIPVLTSFCYLPVDCEVMEWSSWSLCTKNCTKISRDRSGFRKDKPGVVFRSRSVITLPSVGGKRCPLQTQVKACNLSAPPPPCKEYVWLFTRWKSCEIFLKDKILNSSSPCGQGMQTRSIYCIELNDKSKRPVAESLCRDLPVPRLNRNCHVLCSNECQVSEWGTWSGCSIMSCSQKGVRQGVSTRSRSVISPQALPSSCPDLTESRDCDGDLCYKWSTGSLTVCLANDNGQCGEGRHYRSVYCLDYKNTRVSDIFCSSLTRPVDIIPCNKPCAQDCAVSHWGQWSYCTKSCVTEGQSSGKQFRERKIVAYPGPGGEHCPIELRQSQQCNLHPCQVYFWRADPWDECKTASSLEGTFSETVEVKTGDVFCYKGVQTRQVNCYSSDGNNVSSDLCQPERQPITQLPCYGQCPVACMISPWSEWTPCPETCLSTGGNNTSFRYRKVARHPKENGTSCPPVEEMKQLKMCPQPSHCYSYNWTVASWSKCFVTLTRGDADDPSLCGDGIKIRNVTCKRNDGVTSQVQYCLDVESVWPKVTRACSVPCQMQCSLSEWSSWKDCSKSCGTGIQTRDRQVLGDLGNCPKDVKLTDVRKCNEHRCSIYRLESGPWGRCIAADDSPSYCGPGFRHRALKCYGVQNERISMRFCLDGMDINWHDLPENKSSCVVPCPVDCVLGSWSVWSACSSTCGSGMRTRWSRVIQPSLHGGRPCALLNQNNTTEETEPCSSNKCIEFTWKEDSWGRCDVAQHDLLETTCGPGVQRRMVLCNAIDRFHADVTREVDERLCKRIIRPLSTRPCYLPCPGDCVLSEWGPWGTCPQKCQSAGSTTQRMRQVLRRASEVGKPCEQLKETKSCECFTYRWRSTEWGTCALSGNDVCGQGEQTRMYDCVRNDGEVISDQTVCVQYVGSPPTLRTACIVPCPVDCQLSSWTLWGDCSKTCGAPSFKKRSREILIVSESAGRPCPQDDQLKDTLPCYLEPCYEWQTGAWGDCQGIAHSCGRGLQKREVTCSRSDRKLVDDGFCTSFSSFSQETLLPRRTKSCKIPCQGDCEVSPWSNWGPCYKDCKNDSISGTQWRQRIILSQAEAGGEPCPDKMEETMVCNVSIECYQYMWKTGPFIEGNREVWCQRSDGVNVTNGCALELHPETTHMCIPACSVNDTYCHLDKGCICKSGYTPVFDVKGGLVKCLGHVLLMPTPPQETNFGDHAIGFAVQDEDDLKGSGDIAVLLWGSFAACVLFLIFIFTIVWISCRSQSPRYHGRRSGATRVAETTTYVPSNTRAQMYGDLIELSDRSSRAAQPAQASTSKRDDNVLSIL